MNLFFLCKANLNIHLFVYIQKYLLKSFHMSGTVPSAKVTLGNKIQQIKGLLSWILHLLILLINVKFIN